MARTKTVDRPHRVTILMSDAEHAELQALAAKRRLTASDYIRGRNREEYEATFGAKRGRP
jgi:hypothetical protein